MEATLVKATTFLHTAAANCPQPDTIEEAMRKGSLLVLNPSDQEHIHGCGWCRAIQAAALN